MVNSQRSVSNCFQTFFAETIRVQEEIVIL
jgi:hypothetical protein